MISGLFSESQQAVHSLPSHPVQTEQTNVTSTCWDFCVWSFRGDFADNLVTHVKACSPLQCHLSLPDHLRLPPLSFATSLILPHNGIHPVLLRSPPPTSPVLLSASPRTLHLSTLIQENPTNWCKGRRVICFIFRCSSLFDFSCQLLFVCFSPLLLVFVLWNKFVFCWIFNHITL